MISGEDSFQRVGGGLGSLFGRYFALFAAHVAMLKTRRLDGRCFVACDTWIMQLLDPTPRLANDPKSVKINLTTGTGMEIEWKDGHRSSYTFPFLRDACPCALCGDEREKSGRKPGEGPKLAPGALPMFKALAKALSAEQVG